MENNCLQNKIKKLFAMVLKISVNDFSYQSKPSDLPSWHSLNHLILISIFEDNFAIKIEPEEMQKMYTSYQIFEDSILIKINSEK